MDRGRVLRHDASRTGTGGRVVIAVVMPAEDERHQQERREYDRAHVRPEPSLPPVHQRRVY